MVGRVGVVGAGGTYDVMKLKNTFTPPTTGPAQLLELVLVAAALQ